MDAFFVTLLKKKIAQKDTSQRQGNTEVPISNEYSHDNINVRKGVTGIQVKTSPPSPPGMRKFLLTLSAAGRGLNKKKMKRTKEKCERKRRIKDN
jgi:hypothetical protein